MAIKYSTPPHTPSSRNSRRNDARWRMSSSGNNSGKSSKTRALIARFNSSSSVTLSRWVTILIRISLVASWCSTVWTPSRKSWCETAPNKQLPSAAIGCTTHRPPPTYTMLPIISWFALNRNRLYSTRSWHFNTDYLANTGEQTPIRLVLPPKTNLNTVPCSSVWYVCAWSPMRVFFTGSLVMPSKEWIPWPWINFKQTL